MSVNVAFNFYIPSGLGLIHSRRDRGDLPVAHSSAALPGESTLSPSQVSVLAARWGLSPGP